MKALKKKINVLSLFDGISCAKLALEKAKIPINKYFSSEIDSYCIQISKKNHPSNILLGDIKKINLRELPRIDLLIGGSPCQDISHAFKGKGLVGKRSALFFDYVRIKNLLKPKYFLLENVRTKWKNFMDEEIGEEGIEVNSKFFSAQNRPRCYWTNIPISEKYSINKKQIKDIMEKKTGDVYYFNKTVSNYGKNRNLKEKKDFYEIQKIFTLPYSLLKDNERQRRVYSIFGKSPTLLARSDTPKILFKGEIRKLTPLECERLQGIEDNYTAGCSNTQRYKMIGNSFTVPVISYILRSIHRNKKKTKQLDLFK